MTPSPFITCFLDKGEKVIFDVDGQTSYEIASRLVGHLFIQTYFDFPIIQSLIYSNFCLDKNFREI